MKYNKRAIISGSVYILGIEDDIECSVYYLSFYLHLQQLMVTQHETV